MNVLIIAAAVFAVFIIVDIVTAKIFRLKRSAVRNVSLALLCALTLTSGAAGTVSALNKIDTEQRTLYNAYNSLLDGNVKKALENCRKIKGGHSDMIALLAECLNGNYAGAFINSDDLVNSGKLNAELSGQAEEVYSLSRKMTGLDGTALSQEDAAAKVKKIIKNCLELLNISDSKSVEFLSGYKNSLIIESDNFDGISSTKLKNMLLDSPNDKELLRYSVKYFSANDNLSSAEESAKKLLELEKSPESIAIYTDVIAQKFIGEDTVYSDTDDPEIGELLSKAKKARKKAEELSPDDDEYEELIEKADKYTQQAVEVKVNRIVNWISVNKPVFGDDTGVIDLQLSRLYSAAGNDEKAERLLIDLVKSKDSISEESPIKEALDEISAVYSDTSASSETISSAINGLLNNGVFLPDSTLNRSYSVFLNKILKYERVSVAISGVNTDNYPTVRAFLNVNGRNNGVDELVQDFDLDDFSFMDNGFVVPNDKVTRITDDESKYVSIVFSVDVSGSMGGVRLENAKMAIANCVKSMNPDTQQIGIVTYDTSAEIAAPLSNDKKELKKIAESISDRGGTYIPSGLLKGLEALEGAKGTKAIVLMTDGEDNSMDDMIKAIEKANAAHVPVFTVITGGGDREYMEFIAQQTGGIFMSAETDEELISVYSALQSYIVNNYCFEYTVEDASDENPRMLTVGIPEYNVANSFIYSYGGMSVAPDGSYAANLSSGSLRLNYAEPSVVSANDAKLGVPVFISATGIQEGAEVFVNGKKIDDAKIVPGSAITFMLKGSYNSGALSVAVKQPDGSASSSEKLISVSAGTGSNNSSGQTISLGSGGNVVYADKVDRDDSGSLILNGNVTLNGFVHFPSGVRIYCGDPVSDTARKITVESGSVVSDGAVYVKLPDTGYGKEFGGALLKISDNFKADFEESRFELDYMENCSLELAGLGTLNCAAEFDGKEFSFTESSGYYSVSDLKELQSNLNFALNNIPLTGEENPAVALISGIKAGDENDAYNNGALSLEISDMTITLSRDDIKVKGTAEMRGNLAVFAIEDAVLEINTENTDSMFGVKGDVNTDVLQDYIKTDGFAEIEIKSKGIYPDYISIKCGGLTIESSDLNKRFSDENADRAFDAKADISYDLELEDKPYRAQLDSLISNITQNCDKAEFICSENEGNAVRLFNSQDESRYVIIRNGSITVPVNELNELKFFGSDLGGSITGYVTITEEDYSFELSVDGHIDNEYHGVKYDGKGKIKVYLYKDSNAMSDIPVEIIYSGKTLAYDASVTGSVKPDDGFSSYDKE